MDNTRKDIAPRKDLPIRRDLAPRKDLDKGSRPPPSKRPSTSSLSILFVMAFVIAGAFVASGNVTPVDPNGPGGPPTLQPYYNPADYPVQHIVTPTNGYATNKQNLQLETFNVDNCGENSVILFVTDVSGSMQFFNKMGNEKSALSYFTTNMGGLSGVGLISFGDIVKDELPLTYLKDARPQVAKAIANLTPHGYTHTRDAMQMAYDELHQSLLNDDFPGYKYNLVLLTDGVPEIPPPRHCLDSTPDPNTAPLPRCFAIEQDPTQSPDITAEIKALGVDIYVINVYSPDYPSDKYFQKDLVPLLERIASTPLDTHYFVSINGGNLSQVLQSIDSSICYNNFDGQPVPSQ